MRKIFVISDLHLGGRPYSKDETRPAFQFNHSYAALIDFLDWIREDGKKTPRNAVELVINGDIVDFLAEDDYGGESGARIWTGDEREAIQKLEMIASRTRVREKRGVFEALNDFAANGNHLTLLLGNHDMELALPAVRQALLSLLGNHHERIKFIYDGEAYTVGRVLIEHGNRYDRWNMIDHSALRQERSVLSRKLPIDEDLRAERYFVPPAGTHLVIHFMNRIKSRYRFIDLLKPETHAAIPLLLALEPAISLSLDKLLKTPAIMQQFLRHGLLDATSTKYKGALKRTDGGSPQSLRQSLEYTLGSEAKLFDSIRTTGPSENFNLGDVVDWFHSKSQQLLEYADSLSNLLAKRTIPELRRRQLHAGLRALNENDKSYDLHWEKPEYLNAAKQTLAYGDFDAVIYGHTHLPKMLPVPRDGHPAWYMNTGTWCDVIRLPATVCESYEQAAGELQAFIEALEANRFDAYIKRYLTYAELLVDMDNGGCLQSANLHAYCGKGEERCPPLTSFHNVH